MAGEGRDAFRSGAVVVLFVAALLALVVPMAIGLAGAIAAPRAWARRARERETAGHRRIAAGEGEARELVVEGARLLVRSRRVGVGGPGEGRVYAEVVPLAPDDGGAIVVEGESVAEVCVRAKALWERDARLRRGREAAGLELTRAERELLVDWLVRTGADAEAAREVFR